MKKMEGRTNGAAMKRAFQAAILSFILACFLIYKLDEGINQFIQEAAKIGVKAFILNMKYLLSLEYTKNLQSRFILIWIVGGFFLYVFLDFLSRPSGVKNERNF